MAVLASGRLRAAGPLVQVRRAAEPGMEESYVSAPSDCSQAGSIQAAWAQHGGGYARDPQNPGLPVTECARLPELTWGGHSPSHASGDQGWQVQLLSGCTLSCVPWLLHLSAPGARSSPARALPHAAQASVAADPGGRLSHPVFLGGGVVPV